MKGHSLELCSVPPTTSSSWPKLDCGDPYCSYGNGGAQQSLAYTVAGTISQVSDKRTCTALA